MFNEIQKFLNSKAARGVVSALKAKKDYVEFLQQYYNVDSTCDLKPLIYACQNNLKVFPKAVCGAPAKFISVIDGFNYKCDKPFQGKDKCEICCSAVAQKRKETYKEKTGYDNPGQNPEVREQMAVTSEIRHGDRIPQRIDKVKKKTKDTNIERYGSVSPMQNVEVQKKSNETLFKNYGVTNALHLFHPSQQERFDKFKKDSEADGKYILLSTIDKFIEHDGDVKIKTYPFKSIYRWKHIECGTEFDKVRDCLRCPKCEPYSASTEEINLREYIQSIYSGEVISNSRNVIKGQEIDIFLPEIGVGIEFNGEYWHRDEVRGKEYHQDKYISMQKLGHKLITIYSNEWMNKQDIIKSRLNSIIGIDDKIYARKCEIHEIDSSECEDFLNTYHIQGSCSSSIKCGLYYNDELVAVMTFGKPRFNKTYEYELLRYCSKGTVVGGASKLLKYFERVYNPKNLISYADMNWSTGNLYSCIGFEYVEMSKPGYFYYDRKTEIVYSRYQCQKKRLIEKHGFPETMTEKEMTEALGYFKIYDCGNLVYKKEYK